MTKIIVTHQSVDLDAIAAAWLILRFFPGWNTAQLAFVPAECTLEGKLVDSNPSIWHVDTGKGIFDHHQRHEYTSATQLVYEHMAQHAYIEGPMLRALERMVHVITDIDHFAEVFYPEPDADRYEFMAYQIISELKGMFKSDEETVKQGGILLDAILRSFKKRMHAESEIEKGYVYTSYLGKSIVMDTGNDEVLKLAQKMGYKMSARFDTTKGVIRIKCIPEQNLDLTPLYTKLKKKEPKVNWFLHISKHMLFNSSQKSNTFIPSRITPKEFIAITAAI